MSAAARGDRFARVTGFLVFLLGVAVIVAVLWTAFQMLRAPDLGVPTVRAIPAAPAAASSPNLTDIGVGFGRLLAKILLLFLASICGSLIANKGIHLYFSGAPTIKE